MHFSLYRTIQPIATDAISLMSVAAMRVLSHAIEDTVLSGPPGATLVAGFQRMSCFRLQEARYRALAQVCSSLHIYALPDTAAPVIDGITYVPLSAAWPLAREWFVLVNTPGFAVALIAQERDGLRSAPRHYQALFITDANVIDQVGMILLDRADAPYTPPDVRDDKRRQHNIQRIMGRLIAYQQAPAPPSRRSEQLNQVRELTRLIPTFASSKDWQRLLLHSIEQRVDALNA